MVIGDSRMIDGNFRASRSALFTACALGVLAAAGIAGAQEVEGVIVRAARLPPSVGDKALSVVQIGAETLTASDKLDVALTNTPGVQLFRRTNSSGANPTTQGISVRGVAGSGAGRALVTLDGVPQNDPFGGWVIWSALPSESIESATIVRGAGAGPYGAGALTGVIALDERASVPGGFIGEATIGEVGYGRAVGVTQIEVGPTRLFVSASGERGGGFTPVRAGLGAADTPLTVEDWNAAARLSTDIGRSTLAVRIGSYQERRDSGIVGAYSRSEGNSASVTLASPPGEGQLGWRVQSWWRHSNLVNTSVSRDTRAPTNNQYSTPANGYGVNAALRKTTDNLTLEVGTDVRWADGIDYELFGANAVASYREAGGKALVGGVYGEASYLNGPWLFTGGVRVDGWRNTDAIRREVRRSDGFVTPIPVQPDASGTKPTGRVAVRRDFDGGFYSRAGAYAGFRPASLNELHRPFRVVNDVTESNPGLRPEQLYGAEAGFGFDGQNGAASANLFYNQLHDAITNVTLGGPGTYNTGKFPVITIPAGGVLRQRQNAGDVNVVGIEAEGSRRFGDLSLRTSASYTWSEVDGGAAAPQLTGLRPAQTPRFTALAGADYRVSDAFSLSADLKYESQRWDDDQNTRSLAPSFTVDLRGDYAINGPVRLFAAVDNATDETIETAETATGVESFAAPRRFRIGLTYRR
jgi:outer membrane receptor protein involved in Fe transport